MTVRFFFFFALYVMKARNVVIVYQVVFCLSENKIGIPQHYFNSAVK